jgi:hypothetical protein
MFGYMMTAIACPFIEGDRYRSMDDTHILQSARAFSHYPIPHKRLLYFIIAFAHTKPAYHSTVTYENITAFPK